MRNPALETIKAVGVGGLCHTDGCLCLAFTIHHVHVETSCRKSGGNTHPDCGTTIRVYSNSMDYYGDDANKLLQEIGEEVAKQMAEWNGEDPKERFNILLEEYK